eukprot:PhM_4_TR5387/c0_g1_i1/m.11415
MTEYHDALLEALPSYRELATLKLKGWKDGHGYARPDLKLGGPRDYADHYQKTLMPILKKDTDVVIRRFLDMGCAPGGLCQAMFEAYPQEEDGPIAGTGVTLDPKNGGLKMDFSHPRLNVRYADVTDAETFIATAVPDADQRSYDFCNAGIVLDAAVKSMKTGRLVPYHEQLDTQLRVASRAVRPGGWVMVAQKWDFTSLPEVLETFFFFATVVECPVMHMMPCMYTATHARKQFYFLFKLPDGMALDGAVCDAVGGIWQKGRDRYMEFKRRAYEARKASTTPSKRERGTDDPPVSSQHQTNNSFSVAATEEERAHARAVVKGVCARLGSDLTVFCQTLRTALKEQHII